VGEQQQCRAPEPELADEREGVACRPVLDDLVVVAESADDDPPQFHWSPPMCAGKRPAGHDALFVADLFLDVEAQVGEQLAVERDGSARPFNAVVFEVVDVVDVAAR